MHRVVAARPRRQGQCLDEGPQLGTVEQEVGEHPELVGSAPRPASSWTESRLVSVMTRKVHSGLSESDLDCPCQMAPSAQSALMRPFRVLTTHRGAPAINPIQKLRHSRQPSAVP